MEPYKSQFHRPRTRSPMTERLSILINVILIIFSQVSADDSSCPWTNNDSPIPTTIKTRCQCVRTTGIPPGTTNSLLSIQCHEIEAAQLVTVLTHRGNNIQNLELLYLNSSKVTDHNGFVPADVFQHVKIVSLQMSGCGIKGLHPDAFRGQQSTLKHLSLTMNQLKEVPKGSLTFLPNLSLLDLSHNRIIQVPNDSFAALTKLTTLKLNDNNLQLDGNCFRGIEKSLKNLNLKGTRLTQVPPAIRNLSSLTFLDLAQNRIRDLDSSLFTNLNSLTALNLERNLLESVPTGVFSGINDTLSSLSLLNNLLTRYPREALAYVHELRVLDLGFNLLTELPDNAFEGLTRLTLLALDGNPLPTLHKKSFASLNKTLRGLSLGGRFLNCDCRISWIAHWVDEFDLQITSRERNPQFCGNPPELRRLNFYQMKHDDFQCEPNMTSSISTITTTFTRFVNKNKVKIDPKRLPSDVQNPEKQSSIESEESSQAKHTAPSQIESIHDVLQKSPQLSPVNHSISTNDDTTFDQTQNSPFYKNLFDNPGSNTTHFPVHPVKSSSNYQSFGQTGGSLPKAVMSTTSSTSSIVSSGSHGRSLGIGQPTTLSSTTTEDVTTTKLGKEFLRGPDFDSLRIPVVGGVGPKLASTGTTGAGSIVQIRVVTPASTTTLTHGGGGGGGGKRHQNLKTTTSSPMTTTVQNDVFFSESTSIEIQNIERLGESILVQWESTIQDGFRIIYRIFGEDTFRHGPPLAPSEREYRIQNVPQNECLIICVIPFEEIVYNEISPNPSAIPEGSHCRELKPSSPSALMSHMDKVTIGASIAICCTVLIAIVFFIGFTRRTKQSHHDSPTINKIPPGSFCTPSPGPLPILPLTGSMTKDCEWDQHSGVSTRSIPRARVYNMTMDGTGIPARSVLPGHHHHHHQSQPSSHRSYGTGSIPSYNLHHHGTPPSSNNYLANQSRLLRASGQQPSTKNPSRNGGGPEQKQKRRKGTTPRQSNCDSLNTQSGYDTPDNWTDHDMDVYVAQNPTRRDF